MNSSRSVPKLNHKGIAVFCIPWYNKKMKMAEEQKALCNQLVNVEYVRENYNFWRSDEMKGQIQFWGRDAYMEAHKSEYLRPWVELGLKYPTDYLCAWIDMTSGYWNTAAGTLAYANLPYENDLQIENHVVLPRLNGRSNVVLLAFQQNKVLHVFLNIGFHFWLMVVLFLTGITLAYGWQHLKSLWAGACCFLYLDGPAESAGAKRIRCGMPLCTDAMNGTET